MIKENNSFEKDISANDKKWFAVRVKYKCEKLVRDRLLDKEIIAYVPLLKSTRAYASKRKSVETPIIHSYVFVQVSKLEYTKVLRTLHVYDFLKIGNEMIPIRNDEMSLLKQVVGEQINVIAEEKSFVLGDSVEIIRGNLTGIQGVLVEEKNKNEFIVDLPSFGMQLRIEINRAYLRPILNKQLA